MTQSQPSRLRRIAFTGGVVLFALAYSLLFSLILGLLGPAWDAGGSASLHRIHHLGAAVFIALLVLGLLAHLRKPERRVAAFQQATVAIVALELTNLIVGDPDNYGGNVGLLDPALLIFVVPILILAALHPARHQLLHVGDRIKPASLAMAVLGAIPLVIYAVNQALLQRNSWPPAADPHHNGHWMAMATMAFAIALVGLLAALRSSRWQLPAWSAGTAAIVFGLSSMLLPELASSVGRGWGAVSIAGGVGFIAVLTWEARQGERPSGSTEVAPDQGRA